MRYFFSLSFIVFAFALTAQNKLTSPETFFKNYGIQYTPEYKVNEYLNYLSQNSDKLDIVQYGLTTEDRPLQLLYISSPSNLQNIELIRNTNLYNIGLNPTKPEQLIDKAIVWMSFGVHGNEAGASESVPNIVYELLQSDKKDIQGWLENSVIIIDPNLNPDGNSRYTHWINRISGKMLHPDHSDREHYEPWPTGRYNHYIFDLNRDWAWQTQTETQQRIKIYNQWMPHVHADFHEMGYNSNYYFAPAAEPFHKYISNFQRSFQTEIGKNHAKYFDAKGLLYWTREVFDLFYPSYGDTYPTYNGAVGMTYEQAGNSRSGRSILLANGDTLTVKTKIENNTIVALSTIETASVRSQELIQNFKEYFKSSATNPPGKFKTFILKSGAATKRIAELFDKAGIQYEYSKVNLKTNAYHYQSQKNQNAEVMQGDLVIQANQPRSVLLQILMEESPVLSDSLTYDITSWSLPLAYGVDCYALTSMINIETDKDAKELISYSCDSNAYAYVIKWGDLSAVQTVAQILEAGYKVRYAVKDVKFGDKLITKGSAVVLKGDNPRKVDFDKVIQQILFGKGEWFCLSTGFSTDGGDLGGYSYSLMNKPRVLTISGEGTDPTGVGEIWHYFDNVIQYPISILEKKDISKTVLSDYNTFILPGGRYEFTEKELDMISDWVQAGGKLIALEQSIDILSSKEGLGLTKYATDEEKNLAEKENTEISLKAREFSFESFERRYISSGTAGAIVKNVVDDSHPLGFGMTKSYYSLKTSQSHYKLQKDCHNIIHIPASFTSYGFIGAGFKPKLEGTVTFAHRSKGKGNIYYMVDNPLFRGFWDRGLLLFGNALFF
ncbi:MAG: hypothetical protein IPM42_21315 [Saprospiraceae bacterium]|nr:hypothetical protein [Saprospiraceae bacterium]